MLSAVLRAECEPTAGLADLSTPDSILMSYQKSKATESFAEKLKRNSQKPAPWPISKYGHITRWRPTCLTAFTPPSCDIIKATEGSTLEQNLNADRCRVPNAEIGTSVKLVAGAKFATAEIKVIPV